MNSVPVLVEGERKECLKRQSDGLNVKKEDSSPAARRVCETAQGTDTHKGRATVRATCRLEKYKLGGMGGSYE